MKTKEFNQVVKAAKGEVNGMFKSPFVIVNLLNKAAKGDLNKIAGVDNFVRDNIKLVAGEVRKLHKGRYLFDLAVLTKDYKGRFCSRRISKTNSVVCVDDMEFEGITSRVYLDNKGREVIALGETYVTLLPLPLTINAFFSAFAAAAKVSLQEKEKAEKAAKKAEKAAKKEAAKFEAAKKAVFVVFGELANTFTEGEIMDKYERIKGAK